MSAAQRPEAIDAAVHRHDRPAVQAPRRATTRLLALVMALLLFVVAVLMPPSGPASAAVPPAPGGPVLVITSTATGGSANFGSFVPEILRNEGFNLFAVADISTVTASTLAAYDVVVLTKMALPAARVTDLQNWVTAGGNLIALAPDAQLAPLLGLSPSGTQLGDAYLRIDTTQNPGNGLPDATLQYHGPADLYALSGATAVATLFSTATAATNAPAVSVRAVGSGKAAAFTYDLARSVVQTRQGNPAWAAQERDGLAPIRSDDKFFGNASGDAQPDWVDPNKIAIPQADEQQRLFANLLLWMNQSKKPLPRFWYFPNGKKAVVVMTGDDHGNNGTAGRFDQFLAASPAGCSLANWECVRGTSYIYPNTPITDAQAAQYVAQGFEIGLHINTDCNDYTASSLESTYATQLAQWSAAYPSLPPPTTMRHHCIVWSDWASGAQVELNHGMRLDTSYYFWPPGWVDDVPGYFTGSAMPMRFSTIDGQLMDVVQATSQMTDESGQTYPKTIDTLLDLAVGSAGAYGAYTINAHTDLVNSDEANAVVASAKARGVPIISSQQLLTWLDARNNSSFGGFGWTGNTLSFSVSAQSAAVGLQAMLPLRVGALTLTSLSRGGSAVALTQSTIKGVDYATFAAGSGSYQAVYAGDTTPPSVVSTSPTAGATAVAPGSKPSIVFSEAMDASTISSSTILLRTGAGALVSTSVGYDAPSRTAQVVPTQPLAGSTQYTLTVQGANTTPSVRDLAGNAATASTTVSFTTAAAVPPPTCPCSTWPASTVPTTPSENDPDAVELGVRFKADINGYITGVRFYKGSLNTGVHTGSLWTTAGQRLATATFANETATGWQQVTFAQPVAITANTVYIASYFAPNGGYAADSNFFATKGVDNAPVHLLQSGTNGGNGTYAYGSGGGFPSATYQATNYWVDVVFTTVVAADTTPPTVTSVSPALGATGVAPSAAVAAVFSEAIATASLTTATFTLRDGGGNAVPASIGYDASTNRATLTPTVQLAAATTYTATLRGGSTDPRVKDLAGNALAADRTWSFTTGAQSASCTAPPNAIVAENCLAGAPASEWDVSGAGDSSIQGFATQISVNRGSTVSFKVSTSASGWRADIYRMGYYGGAGARKVGSITPTASLPQTQPTCLNDAATGLIDCGNWAVSASWAVPATATSGIYFARLIRNDTGGASHVVFVVRDDASTADLLFQTSDTTWQAYNTYGGNSLYQGGPGTNPSRAYKVSYNRPFITRSVDGGQDWVFNAEYPMVRWLESNGYAVSYAAGADMDRAGSVMQQHKVVLSVGHDEYWSAGQRANFEAARNAGTSLAFFSGNEIFWKTRWENSIDGSGTAYRTLVCYKETSANAKIDPTATWTGSWRDPRFSPPADGGKPENALSGTQFMVNDGATTAITVPAADGKLRLWRNTSIASLANGAVATLAPNTLGYEWDVVPDNSVRPPGEVTFSTTTVNNAPVLQDYGSTYASGTAVHRLGFYKHASGAKVFGAGTVQWTWGLDANHDRGNAAADVRMQQATVNLLADLNAQPATLQAGLVAAAASTDSTAPTSTITAPAANSSVAPGAKVTISGTAADAGGGQVGVVEISTDGGSTWHAATGRASWSYSWTAPTAAGAVTLRSRAADDSGNIEVPSAGTTVTVQGGGDTTPPTITGRSPASGATNVLRGTNVTVTFSEAMTASTLNGNTVQLRTPGGALVNATVSYSGLTRTATLNPTVNLSALTTYTVTVVGGTTDPRVKDAAGDAMAATQTWSFKTR